MFVVRATSCSRCCCIYTTPSATARSHVKTQSHRLREHSLKVYLHDIGWIGEDCLYDLRLLSDSCPDLLKEVYQARFRYWWWGIGVRKGTPSRR